MTCVQTCALPVMRECINVIDVYVSGQHVNVLRVHECDVCESTCDVDVTFERVCDVC